MDSNEPVTNLTIRRALHGGNINGYTLSSLLKTYFKNPIRVGDDVTSAQQRDKSSCGNYAVINQEKRVYDNDMDDELVEFAKGLFI